MKTLFFALALLGCILCLTIKPIGLLLVIGVMVIWWLQIKIKYLKYKLEELQ